MYHLRDAAESSDRLGNSQPLQPPSPGLAARASPQAASQDQGGVKKRAASQRMPTAQRGQRNGSCCVAPERVIAIENSKGTPFSVIKQVLSFRLRCGPGEQGQSVILRACRHFSCFAPQPLRSSCAASASIPARHEHRSADRIATSN